MDNNIMERAMLAGWASYGVNLEKITDNFDIYISVPEHSEHVNVNGEEMAGNFLASRIQRTLREQTKKKIIVKYRIRIGENWTKKMGDEAILKSLKETDSLYFLEDLI